MKALSAMFSQHDALRVDRRRWNKPYSRPLITLVRAIE